MRASCGSYRSVALRPVGYQFVDHAPELWKRTGLHFLHCPAAMHLHRGFSDADIVGNLFAQAAASDLNHDVALPRTERLEPFSESSCILLVFPPRAIARYADLNGIEKVLIAER